MKDKGMTQVINRHSMVEADEDKAAEYLGISLSKLEAEGSFYTAKEIFQQPELWRNTWKLIADQQSGIETFLNEAFASEDLDVILTGAGTSAFIGKILQGPFQNNTRKRTRAVATTDLVSHPQLYFHEETPTLLVSFARSGNSPESVAAVNLANLFCRKTHHLIITCNPSGKLASDISQNPTFVFLLPQEADDQSLAMTGSFTSMLLAGLLFSQIGIIQSLRSKVERLADYGENILKRYAAKLEKVARLDFQRAVFLGSGPLQGTARESQLKLQELTDGKVICKYDSFLGFRHGPKAVINPATLIVYLFSNYAYVHQYEVDLVKAINAGEKGLFSIGISETAEKLPGVDLAIILSQDGEKLEEEFFTICSVLPAQIHAFYKSLQLGLKPDSPSMNGTITRVVEGVTIYPYFQKPGVEVEEII